MGVFQSSGGLATNAAASEPTLVTPNISNTLLALADTEYSIAVPDGAKSFELRARGNSTLQISYTLGESGTKYITLRRGCSYREENLGTPPGLTLYVRSSSSNETVELLTWT